MRPALLAACVITSAGCPGSDEGSPCPTEVVFEAPAIHGGQLALIGDNVAWMETNPDRVLIGAIDGSSSTASGQSGLFALGPGMATYDGRVYWTAILENMTDSALFATDLSGITTTIATFPLCTDLIDMTVAGNASNWVIAFGDCDGGPAVLAGNAIYSYTGVHDVLPGYALTDDRIVEYSSGAWLDLPTLDPRRFALRNGKFYVVGNDQVFEIEPGGATRELARNLIGALDLVVDDYAVYVATSMDDDPDLYRVPLDGDDPKLDPEIIGVDLGGTLVQDDFFVYWTVRGRTTPAAGVYRTRKCLI